MSRWHQFFFSLALALGLARAGAAEANRYLLVVQTSKEMKPALAETRACLRTLIAAEFSRQLRAGDTVGLWTYDSELHAGKFPLQVWAADAREAVARQVDDFLLKQSFKEPARIEKLLPALFRVVEDSPALTVLLVTDGFEPVTGTPFDEVINRVFAEHRTAMRKAQTPFVVVILARGGKILRCTVNSAAGAVSIPTLPPPVTPPKPAAPVAEIKPPPPPRPVARTNASLIVDYSKVRTNASLPPTEPVTSAVPKVAIAPPPSTNPVTSVAPSNPPPAVVTPKPPVAPPTTAVAVVRLPTNAPATNAPLTSAVPAVVKPVKVEAVVASNSPSANTNLPVRPQPAAADEVGNGRWLWLLCGLLGSGLLVWAGLAWRGRGAARVSAITESIERRKR